MTEMSIEAQIWSQLDDSVSVGEVIDQLDGLSMTPDLHPEYKLAIERMAFELTAQQSDLPDAYRRFRMISYNPKAAAADLGRLLVRLGDLAVDLRNDVTLGRIRTELARLLSGRGPASPATQGDWDGLAETLTRWDRPEAIRAERAFETLVDDWMRDGGPEQAAMMAELRVLAHNACLLVPDGSADTLINGRRAFWAITLLVGETGDLPAAWSEYRTHGGDMAPSSRAAALLVIARALETQPGDRSLLTEVSLELMRVAKIWPVPRSLKDQRVRFATAPVLIQLAEVLAHLSLSE